MRRWISFCILAPGDVVAVEFFTFVFVWLMVLHGQCGNGQTHAQIRTDTRTMTDIQTRTDTKTRSDTQTMTDTQTQEVCVRQCVSYSVSLCACTIDFCCARIFLLSAITFSPDVTRLAVIRFCLDVSSFSAS